MPDIFISYARDNSYGQHLAERVHEQLPWVNGSEHVGSAAR